MATRALYRSRSESDLSAYHSRGSESFSSLERTRERTNSFASGRIGSPLVSPSSRSFSPIPPLTPITAHTHLLGKESIHGTGFRGTVSMDPRTSAPHALVTAKFDPTEDSEEVLDFEFVHEESRYAGKVHGTPVLSFTLGIDRAGRTIEDTDGKKAQDRNELFCDLKDILHEQRPIEYSITHHEITAYEKQPDGRIVKKRYSLNLDEDVLRLLKDNGVVAEDATLDTPGVREVVDQAFDELTEVNQELLDNTKHLTGNASKTWARNVLGSKNGPSLTLTSSSLVNSVFGKQDYREKLLRNHFCDRKYGFVKEVTERVPVVRHAGQGHMYRTVQERKKQVLTPKGVKTLQKMEEAQRFRDHAKNVLKTQLEIREKLVKDLQNSEIGPEDVVTELPRLEAEIRQIQSVINEIQQTPQLFIVDWTIMMQEANHKYTVPAASGGTTVHESGRELMTKHDGDSRYADWSVKQSEKALTALMTEAGTKRQKWYHISKSKPELSPEDRQAMATVASLPYFIHANADRDDSMPMQFAHRRYLESHGAQMPKVPTVALVLFGAAQTVCDGENFNLRGLGKGLPAFIEADGSPKYRGLEAMRKGRQETFESAMQAHLTDRRAGHGAQSPYQVGGAVPKKLLATG